MTHLTDEQLALHYYGEALADEGAVSLHVRECNECGSRLEQLRTVLGSIQIEVPEPPEDYEALVWHNLRGHLPERQRKWWWLPSPQRWAAVGAVAALLFGAFFLGRMSHVSENPPTIGKAPQAPQIQAEAPHDAQPRVETKPRPEVNRQASGALDSTGRDRILLVALGDHLERSQMVLVELMNATPGESVDISSQRKLAEDLVSENRLYRQTAARTKDSSVANLLDELERVLVDIAHEPSKLSGPELASVKERIEAQGIVFKVRVVGSQMRQRKQQHRTESGKTVVQRG